MSEVAYDGIDCYGIGDHCVSKFNSKLVISYTTVRTLFGSLQNEVQVRIQRHVTHSAT